MGAQPVKPAIAFKLLVTLFAATMLVAALPHWRSWLRGAMLVGTSAPAVTLPLLDGGRAQVSPVGGQPTVLAFWASWCAPCMAELPELDRLAQRFGDRAHFFAVNIEGDRAPATAAAAQLKLRLPVAVDDGAAAGAYAVTGIPHIVLIHADGKIAGVLRGRQSAAALEHAIAALVAGRQ
jgi:thiol-disulfide isomerase/thioredoxin